MMTSNKMHPAATEDAPEVCAGVTRWLIPSHRSNQVAEYDRPRFAATSPVQKRRAGLRLSWWNSQLR